MGQAIVTQPNSLSVYYTTERGKVAKTVAPMEADQTKRSKVLNLHTLANPAPGAYRQNVAMEEATSQISHLKQRAKSMAQQVRKQPRLMDGIKTVPSIPNRTQVFFIPDDEEQNKVSVIPDSQQDLEDDDQTAMTEGPLKKNKIQTSSSQYGLNQ